jgi:transposase
MEIHLTDTQRDELQIFQRNVEKRSEYVKVTTILLLDKGLSIPDIADYLGIDSSTIYRYINSYISDGLVAYLQTDYQGYWGRLSSHQISQLRKELNTNLYLDSKEVVSWIYTRWGITYTHQGVVDLLNRIGFTYKQTKCVPCEADRNSFNSLTYYLNKHLIMRVLFISLMVFILLTIPVALMRG